MIPTIVAGQESWIQWTSWFNSITRAEERQQKAFVCPEADFVRKISKCGTREDDLKRALEESNCLQRTYDKYIDFTIVNEDFDVTFRKVIEQLEKMSTEHQWVPVNWVY